MASKHKALSSNPSTAPKQNNKVDLALTQALAVYMALRDKEGQNVTTFPNQTCPSPTGSFTKDLHISSSSEFPPIPHLLGYCEDGVCPYALSCGCCSYVLFPLAC
jgi:hypothetical protein